MMCPTCGASTSKVYETRRGAFSTTTRRRECPAGHRFNTREVHETVWGSAKQRAEVFYKSFTRRIQIIERDKTIANTLHQGWRVLVERYGIDKSAIYMAAARGRKHLKADVNR